MLGKNQSEPALFQMVDIESIVPAKHMLRRLDSVLDLSFVREEVAKCYATARGRPSIDPELAVRMMILGVVYNLSDRELCDELAMHAGMRWFCRLNFHDPVPDHSTLSRLRNERWAQSGLFERLFDEVLRQCSEAGMVSGRHLSVDGTEIKANASVKSLTPRDWRNPPPPTSEGPREPQPGGAWSAHGVKFSNETHRSVTDFDARLYRKGNGRSANLCYLAHDLIDTKSRVILRRAVTRATGSAEREAALQMLDEVLQDGEALGLPQAPEILTADTGYGTAAFVADVIDRGVLPHIPLLSSEKEEPVPVYRRRTFDLDRQRRRVEKIRRAEACQQVRAQYQTRGYQVSRKLRVRSEHLFAEGKNEHGLDRARHRGLSRVQRQMTLVAVVQNLKRLAAYVGRSRGAAASAAMARLKEPASRITSGFDHAYSVLHRLLSGFALPIAAWSPAKSPS
jgi:IS5 family transposase